MENRAVLILGVLGLLLSGCRLGFDNNLMVGKEGFDTPVATTQDSGESNEAEVLDAGNRTEYSPNLLDSDGNGGIYNVSQNYSDGGLEAETTPDHCQGRVISQTFRYALCSCNNTIVSGNLLTDAFDSDKGPYVAGSAMTGAAIGVNGTLAYMGIADVGGSLTVADQQGFVVPASVQVRGDLRVQGPFGYVGQVDVGNNCWLGSGSVGVGTLQIAGNLTTSTMANLVVPSVTAFVGGETLIQPVTIQPPCACGDNEFVNVTEIIADGKAQNDNRQTGFDPTSLSEVFEFQTIELPDRAFATNINIGGGGLTFVVHQKTTLFVEGDFVSQGFLTLDMDPQSELDLFIGGNLVLAGIMGIQIFGNPNWPGRVRIYVEGDQEIVLAGFTGFAGSLYAPHADVTLSGIQDFYGSIFANNINALGDFRIHYDRAIIREGKDCSPPDRCTVCSDCEATSACVDGYCGDCREAADCCEPLVCIDGQCGVLIP